MEEYFFGSVSYRTVALLTYLHIEGTGEGTQAHVEARELEREIVITDPRVRLTSDTPGILTITNGVESWYYNLEDGSAYDGSGSWRGLLDELYTQDGVVLEQPAPEELYSILLFGTPVTVADGLISLTAYLDAIVLADGRRITFPNAGGSTSFNLPLRGTAGNDTIFGFDRNDHFGFDFHDTISGLGGDDTLHGQAGNDILLGGGGNDNLLGEAGNDSLDGGSGDDMLDGGVGADILNGGIGNDHFWSDGFDTVNGGDGNDYVELSGVLGGVLNGGAGIDNLQLDSLNFNAASGTTVIIGFETIQASLYGTGGNDAVNLSSFTGSGLILIDGYAGNDTITGSAIGDTIFGGDGDDIINGGLGDDFIQGNAGADTLNGGGGNDYIETDGQSQVSGDDGNDTVRVLSVAGGSLNGNAGIDRLEMLDIAFDGTSGSLALSGFEDIYVSLHGTQDADFVNMSGFVSGTGTVLIQGYGGDDTITGTGIADNLYGGDGDDIINGGLGDDFIHGNAGADTLNGGGGNDYIETDGQAHVSGGGGNDTVRVLSVAGGNLNGNAGIDRLEMLDIAFDGTSGSLVLSGFEDIHVSLHGTQGADFVNMSGFVSGTGTVSIQGYGGDDTITGTGIADVIYGGDGEDILIGGGGNDFIVGEGGADRINGGNGNDTVSGDAGNDILQGSSGADTLQGDDGNDQLTGGTGRDVLTGGFGRDTFGYASLQDSGPTLALGDYISDFNQIEGDRINLRAIDADTVTGGDQAFTFIGNNAFSGNGGEVRFAFVSGVTRVLVDLDGNAQPDFLVALEGIHTLTAADFML